MGTLRDSARTKSPVAIACASVLGLLIPTTAVCLWPLTAPEPVQPETEIAVPAGRAAEEPERSFTSAAEADLPVRALMDAVPEDTALEDTTSEDAEQERVKRKKRALSKIQCGRIFILPVDARTNQQVQPSKIWLQEVWRLPGGEVHTTRRPYVSSPDAKRNDGAYSVETVGFSVPLPCSPGRHRVGVEAQGLGLQWSLPLDLDGESDCGPLLFRLEPGGRIEGLVHRAATGLPISGAKVQLLTQASDGRFWITESNGVTSRSDYGSRESTVTDRGGSFVFDGLAQGVYALRVEATQLPTITWEPIVVVVSRPVAPLDIAIPEGGAISGGVLLSDPALLKTVTVPVVLHQPHGWRRTVTADDLGHYLVERLAPGRYHVEVGRILPRGIVSPGAGGHGGLVREPDHARGIVMVRNGQTAHVAHDLRFTPQDRRH